MQLSEIKTQVLTIPGITAEWVRAEFGDLRLKATWQAALDRCGEFIAAVVDAAPVVSEQATVAAQITVAVVVPCLWAVLWLACFAYHTGQAVADWWHSTPSKATDSQRVILSRFQDSRLSSTITIG
jgi:hypothetical protein